jgi:hypothetical protein
MNKILRKRISNLTLLLIVAATGLLIAGAVALNRPLPEYLVAKASLIPGEKIGIESFELQRLNLGIASNRYLSASNAPDSFYLSEMVMEGELVATRKVQHLGPEGFTTIVLNPSMPLSQKVSAGTWVQIWRTIPAVDNFLGELLVTRSQVVAVTQDDAIASDRGEFVEVLVSQQQSALLLQTISAEFDVYILVAP